MLLKTKTLKDGSIRVSWSDIRGFWFLPKNIFGVFFFSAYVIVGYYTFFNRPFQYPKEPMSGLLLEFLWGSFFVGIAIGIVGFTLLLPAQLLPRLHRVTFSKQGVKVGWRRYDWGRVSRFDSGRAGEWHLRFHNRPRVQEIRLWLDDESRHVVVTRNISSMKKNHRIQQNLMQAMTSFTRQVKEEVVIESMSI